jgi:hypothetical protein
MIKKADSSAFIPEDPGLPVAAPVPNNHFLWVIKKTY